MNDKDTCNWETTKDTINFNDKIQYIERVLGCKLLDWQKAALKSYDMGEKYFMYPGRAIGRTTCLKALKILKILNESLERSVNIWEKEDIKS